jgi:hypothetical protein
MKGMKSKSETKRKCVTRTLLFSGTAYTHTGCLLFTLKYTHTLSKHSIYPETRSASEMHFLFRSTCSLPTRKKEIGTSMGPSVCRAVRRAAYVRRCAFAMPTTQVTQQVERKRNMS